MNVIWALNYKGLKNKCRPKFLAYLYLKGCAVPWTPSIVALLWIINVAQWRSLRILSLRIYIWVVGYFKTGRVFSFSSNHTTCLFLFRYAVLLCHSVSKYIKHDLFLLLYICFDKDIVLWLSIIIIFVIFCAKLYCVSALALFKVLKSVYIQYASCYHQSFFISMH